MVFDYESPGSPGSIGFISQRGGRKVTGYRVQAYSGGNSRADRQKAENIGNAIKMRFPDLPIYVHFYSPRWICRVGNFRTYQEANEVLKEVKSIVNMPDL